MTGHEFINQLPGFTRVAIRLNKRTSILGCLCGFDFFFLLRSLLHVAQSWGLLHLIAFRLTTLWSRIPFRGSDVIQGTLHDQTRLVSIGAWLLNPANPEIENKQLQPEALGAKAYNSLCTDRLESDPPTVKFHDKMTNLKLKTFGDLSKKLKVQGSQGRKQ